MRKVNKIANFYLYEIWSDPRALEAHLNSEGFKGWKAYSDPLIVGFNVKTQPAEKELTLTRCPRLMRCKANQQGLPKIKGKLGVTTGT